MRPWGTAFKTDCLRKIRKHTQIDSDLESKPAPKPQSLRASPKKVVRGNGETW